MKEFKESITTILIVFVALKLIDFSDMGILDYVIIILAVIYAVISVASWFGNGGRHA